MSQQLESGNVQPNVNPPLQSSHESGDLQPNHKSGGERPKKSKPNNHSSKPNNRCSHPKRRGGGQKPNANPPLPSTGISGEPQLSQPQNAGTGEPFNHYRSLHIAAQCGDWESAKRIIDREPKALTAKITDRGRTLLHVAAFFWQWGFVLKLLELKKSTELCLAQTVSGNTVLHYVAQGGSLKTAKALVQKNPDLLGKVNDDKELPLYTSISGESRELIWYLSLQNKFDYNTCPEFKSELPVILRSLIESGHLDIALYFVRKYPDLAIANDESGTSLLYWLATNPSHFFSGSNLGFFKRLIYKFVQVDITPTHSVRIGMEDISISEGCASQELRWFKRLIRKTIAPLATSIKMVRDAKLKHECGVALVNLVCEQLSKKSFEDIQLFLQNPKRIMASAVTGGIEEIVRILFQQFPDLMDVDLMPERNILHAAIEHRQVKIYNLIKETHPSLTKNLSSYGVEYWSSYGVESGDDLSSYGVESGDNFRDSTLHLAGKLAPAFKLYSVSGAALQLQRELQWFKEVENITFSYQREKKNFWDETAKDHFRNEHKKLAEQGEKWMKDTANSCMLVSTLIATVLFAAAFTVPGGNLNDKGIPMFLRTKAFTVFAISNALGLFSSLTSLLMFLAILTARYELDDFLESLPNKLIIGLGSLFFAIAAMIIAFGATLTIVLSERWNLVFVPITLLASFPVAMFVVLQLPLFIQMVQSTYGASMFCPWPSRV